MDYTDDVADGIARFNYAFQTALDMAAANGGGIVYFPEGRYLMTNSFVIPENTVFAVSRRRVCCCSGRRLNGA